MLSSLISYSQNARRSSLYQKACKKIKLKNNNLIIIQKYPQFLNFSIDGFHQNVKIEKNS